MNNEYRAKLDREIRLLRAERDQARVDLVEARDRRDDWHATAEEMATELEVAGERQAEMEQGAINLALRADRAEQELAEARRNTAKEIRDILHDLSADTEPDTVPDGWHSGVTDAIVLVSYFIDRLPAGGTDRTEGDSGE